MSDGALQRFTYPGVTTDIMSYIPDVVYSHRKGQELNLSLFVQKSLKYDPAHAKKLPLIVYLEGSGYLHPNYNIPLGQLAALASHGFTVAMVTCGSFLDGWTFEEIHKNYKTAIRFLRLHAEDYGIDPENVIAWGTSSGGTSAVFAGLSGDLSEYKTEEFSEVSDRVQCVVSMAGPQDLFSLLDGTNAGKPYFDSWMARSSGLSWKALLQRGSTAHLLEKSPRHCPFYLVHSMADEMVPFHQTEQLYHRLVEMSFPVRMVVLDNAPHQNTLTTEILEDAVDFIRKVTKAS